MMWRLGLVVAVLAVVGCGGIADWDADADVDMDMGVDSDSIRHMCRGVLGLQCPAGRMCVDLRDGCEPYRGDRDCLGECVER